MSDIYLRKIRQLSILQTRYSDLVSNGVEIINIFKNKHFDIKYKFIIIYPLFYFADFSKLQGDQLILQTHQTWHENYSFSDEVCLVLFPNIRVKL